VAAFAVLSAARGRVDPLLLAELVGLALLVAFASRWWSSAERPCKGMLAAGERGERLASGTSGCSRPRSCDAPGGCRDAAHGCSVAGHDHGTAADQRPDG
jgi:hypothetical protein